MLTNRLFHRVNINRATFTPDASGGMVRTLVTSYDSLPCNVQPVAATWKALYYQRQSEVTHTVYFGLVLEISKEDEIVFGERKFRVVGWRNLIEDGRVFVVDCVEFK